jgi:hypothetical protein
MEHLLLTFLCFAQIIHARLADTKMYLSSACHSIKSMGKNTCAYCNGTGVPHCDYNAYWNPCVDKAVPNPCSANEILAVDGRDYLTNYDDTCKKVCPGEYCYSNTVSYDDMCCSCPVGYKPSVTPPDCRESRAQNVAVNCVGCENVSEELVGSDQKGWECLPRTSSVTSSLTASSSIAKPTGNSTCDLSCSKDTWCPANWVLKKNKSGKQSKLCHCNSGNCKDKDATCPTACLVKNPAVPSNCPAISCPKVNDKDKCFPSQKGLDLIRSQEALCTTFYNACDGVKTIGILLNPHPLSLDVFRKRLRC